MHPYLVGAPRVQSHVYQTKRAFFTFRCFQNTVIQYCAFYTRAFFWHSVAFVKPSVVKKQVGKMIFLRKIIPGATDDSYGIEVAKLAGLPASVVNRAREILSQLELEGAPAPTHIVKEEPDDQISMLDLTSQQVCAALEKISVETLTPIEAMNELYKLKKMLQ